MLKNGVWRALAFVDLKPTYGWMGALPCMLYVCVPEDDDVVVGGVLISALYCCLRPQCVQGPFFVQKLQILEKLEKWSIFIFVSKLTIFSGEKIRNV